MDHADRIRLMTECVTRRNFWLCQNGKKVVSAFDSSRLEPLARDLFTDRYPGYTPEVETYSDGSIHIYKPNTSKPYIVIE